MRRPAVLLSGLLATAVLVGGCAGDDPPPPTQETAVDDTSTTPTPSDPGPGAGSPQVRLAVDDLAAMLGVDAAEVEVVAVEEVTWRNGSRGCAEPGMSYTQALVDGSRITLRAGGRTYEYHSGGSRPPARCEKPTE